MSPDSQKNKHLTDFHFISQLFHDVLCCQHVMQLLLLEKIIKRFATTAWMTSVKELFELKRYNSKSFTESTERR